MYNRIIARDEMTMAVSVAYQKAEEERLDQLNASLHRFLHVEKERLQVSQQMLASLETHVQSLSRAEDIQMLIHNQRDPDNMHFQGKALALLDWQWSKMQVDHAAATRRHPLGLLERRSSAEDGSFASPTSSSASTTISSSPRRGPAINPAVAAMASVAPLDSPHTVLNQTPMSAALHNYFAEDVEHDSSFSEVDASESREDLPRPPSSVNSGGEPVPAPQVSNHQQSKTSAVDLVRETCKTAEGRALFVKCLNRQRSLETKVKNQASFDALVACFNAFLDECVQEDDIKAAKTAMILAETFYYPKPQSQVPAPNGDKQDSRDPLRNGCSHEESDDAENLRRRRSSLCADCRDYTERTSEELLQYVDEAHPLLHGGGIGRGATRTYLQEEVKKHAIWKTPSVSTRH
ncbi:unnamed protein product [Phytophthora lilii]|uniref:Unnamed protein product n=1 Tax=Phytophthora lilii TaxID=2077276 RepID=A0A9W6YK33_9STRA|nr:unnamed protein product [Phytophthora lilii]